MTSRPVSNILIYLFALIAFISGYVLGQSPLAPIPLFSVETTTPEETIDDFTPFWDVWNLVHTRYFNQPVDDALLTEGAIDGMLAVLDDPHTRYLSPDDEAREREEMAGEFQGIGALVEDVDGNITIVSPFDGSPAEAAGLLPGDILREADNVDLSGMSIDEAVLLVRGPAGTPVNLVIERDGQIFEVEIIRDVIKVPSVRGEIIEDEFVYIRLSRFGNRTVEELEATLTSLLVENPVGLILDLRRNPGGGLDTVVDIADHFLAEGDILVEQFGDGREIVFKSDNEGLAQDIPIVVLIDEGSASASEVLAGAIRDRERGILIGQRTFGRGTVQTWHSLSNGGGLRISNARWLTPDQVWVHGEGLTPDYFIPLEESDDESGPPYDTQLQAAIDFLMGKSVISIPPDNEN